MDCWGCVLLIGKVYCVCFGHVKDFISDGIKCGGYGRRKRGRAEENGQNRDVMD